MSKHNLLGMALLASVFMLAAPNSSDAKIFDRNEVESSDINDFKKWKSVLKNEKAYEKDTPWLLTEWRAETKEFESIKDNQEMISKVNEYINDKIEYVEDSKNWGENDYWASPAETFAKGKGDCEDYAIAKYFTLKALGFDERKMRIVILRDLNKNEIHAVLAVNDGGKNYILDNQSVNVQQDVEIAYYQPLYSINSHNWWRNT